jgi:hypothetical protein
VLTRQGGCASGRDRPLGLARLLGIGELYVFGAVRARAAGRGRAVRAVTRSTPGRPARLPLARPRRPAQPVEVRIRNLRRTETPVLRLRDPVSAPRVPSCWSRRSTRGGLDCPYRLPPTAGAWSTSAPLRVVVTDPFGLAHVHTVAAPRWRSPCTRGGGHPPGPPSPPATTRWRDAAAPRARPRGDDFYALRPYVWATTCAASTGLHRPPRRAARAPAGAAVAGRTTVLLDVRRATHDAASFEGAVSAAASIVTANSERRDLIRLATTDGADSGFGSGSVHVQALLEHSPWSSPPAAPACGPCSTWSSGTGRGALSWSWPRPPGTSCGPQPACARSSGWSRVRVDAGAASRWRHPRRALAHPGHRRCAVRQGVDLAMATSAAPAPRGTDDERTQ